MDESLPRRSAEGAQAGELIPQVYDELRRLAVPTLVIWGDHDPVGTVQAGQAAAELMPGARLEVVPGGHVPYLGDPQRVAELVSRFLRA